MVHKRYRVRLVELNFRAARKVSDRAHPVGVRDREVDLVVVVRVDNIALGYKEMVRIRADYHVSAGHRCCIHVRGDPV